MKNNKWNSKLKMLYMNGSTNKKNIKVEIWKKKDWILESYPSYKLLKNKF